jgi:peptidoglycan endopeptidase LytE
MKLGELAGIPYKEKGHTPEGFDCYGFYAYGEKIGGHYVPVIDYEDTKEETFNRHEPDVEKLLTDNIKEVTYPVAEYDTVVFYNSKGESVHVGIYLGNNMFMHCDRHGVHVDCLLTYFRTNRRYFTWR